MANENIKPFLFRKGERDWLCVEVVSPLFFHVRGLKKVESESGSDFIQYNNNFYVK